MTINLNGIEIEIVGDVQIKLSEDGKHLRVEALEPFEKIRVIESPVVEKIRIVEVEKPCTLPHYQYFYNNWPYYGGGISTPNDPYRTI
ncbi:MAG TPA: hypothetical protein VIH61_03870, partial [Waddliaceae bacterium]